LRFARLAILLASTHLTAHAAELGGEFALIQGGARSGSLHGSLQASPKTDVGARLSWTTYPGNERGSSFHLWSLIALSERSNLRVTLGTTKSPDFARTLDLGVRGSYEANERWNLSAGLERAFSSDVPTLTLGMGITYTLNDAWLFGADLSSTSVPLASSLSSLSKRNGRRARSLASESTGSKKVDFGLWASHSIHPLTTLGASLYFSSATQPITESISEISTSAEREVSEHWRIGASLSRSSSSLLKLAEWSLAFNTTYTISAAKTAASK
jgi:hypothetical protein